MKTVARLVVALLFGSLAIACGGSDVTPPAVDGGTATDSGSSSACSVVGNWSTTLATSLPGGGPITGTIMFTADGKLSATYPLGGLNATAMQDYTVSGSQLTISHSGGTLACPEPNVMPTTGPNVGMSLPDVGVYTFAFSSGCDMFTLKLVSDPCSVQNLGGSMRRAEDLDGSTYKKQ